MNRVLSFLISSMILLSFACPQKEEDPIAIADQLLEAMEQAYNDGDLKKVGAFYSDDAKLIAPGGFKVEGRAAVDDYWMSLSPVKWELTPAKTSTVENDLYETDYWKNLKNKPPHWKEHNITIAENEKVVYQLGHSTLQYEREDATVQTSDVDFVLVWKKESDGTYKVFIDTYASN